MDPIESRQLCRLFPTCVSLLLLILVFFFFFLSPPIFVPVADRLVSMRSSVCVDRHASWIRLSRCYYPALPHLDPYSNSIESKRKRRSNKGWAVNVALIFRPIQSPWEYQDDDKRLDRQMVKSIRSGAVPPRDARAPATRILR